MTVESDFEYLLRRLAESKGDYMSIATATGVPYWTLVKVARREVNPKMSTVEPLIRHFRSLDQAASGSATA